MQVTRVRGNVKAGCDVEIGAKTLIVGPNGSGKSSIVNTVELALTARAGDIAGRVDIGREADVMSLAHGGAASIQAEAHFDTGEAAVYHTEGSTAKAKKAQHLVPGAVKHDDVLPIRALREALLGSPATARKYLLGQLDGGVTLEAARVMISEAHRSWFDSLTHQPGRPADVLVAALEAAGSKAREGAATAKASKQAAAFVTGGAAVPPSNEEIAAMQAKARDLQSAYVEAVAQSARGSDLPFLRAEVEKAEAEAVEAIGAYKTAQAALEALERPALPANLPPAVLTVAKDSVDGGECLVCGNTDMAPVAELLVRVDSLLVTYTAAKKTYDEAERASARTKKEADTAIATFERAERRLADVEGATAPAEPVDVEALKAQYDAALQQAEDLKAKRSAWDTAAKAQKQASAAEAEAKAWNELKGELATVVEKLVDGALAAFVARVQSGLPTTDTFAMRLRDGEREVVQFGLVRDGQLHTALSGAEWARVIAAMASACVTDGQYACIIPEERAFDPATLAGVMRALGTSPHQVILTSPVAPKSPPKGWTIIKRGEE